MKKNIFTNYILLATLFFCSCRNNDSIILKEIKQQNKFLEEQLSFSKASMKAKSNGNPAQVPYYKLFVKQDSVMRLFLKSIVNCRDDEKIITDYTSFIKQSNIYFNTAQNGANTKVLPDDLFLTQLTFDSLLLRSNLDSLKTEFITQQILQRYLTIVQIYTGTSSYCGLRFNNPDCIGFRLTIEKASQNFLLNLKCTDPTRTPYSEHLEFVSISKNNSEGYYYSNDLTDISAKIIESKNEKDAIIIKIKPLEKGFYKIYCKKLSISDNGRIMKREARFDFEITKSQ